MTRFFLTSLAILGLALTSCKKEDNNAENCIESQISYPYVDVKATTTAPGQVATGTVIDTELYLTVSPTACNSVKVNVGASLGGFEADCVEVAANNTITGSSTDGNSSYVYDKSGKSITVTYKTATGFTYIFKALRP